MTAAGKPMKYHSWRPKKRRLTMDKGWSAGQAVGEEMVKMKLVTAGHHRKRRVRVAHLEYHTGLH